MATLDDPQLVAVYLHAAPEFLRERIQRESGYADQDVRRRGLIDRFITRSLRDNEELRAAAEAHQFGLIDVADADGLERATERLIQDLQH